METKTIEVSAALAKEIERLQDHDFIKQTKDCILKAFDDICTIYAGGVVMDADALRYAVSNYFEIIKAVEL